MLDEEQMPTFFFLLLLLTIIDYCTISFSLMLCVSLFGLVMYLILFQLASTVVAMTLYADLQSQSLENVLYYHRAIKTVYVVEGWKITVH
jgi:hypothetical protein